jgi:hypothetical protein
VVVPVVSVVETANGRRPVTGNVSTAGKKDTGKETVLDKKDTGSIGRGSGLPQQDSCRKRVCRGRKGNISIGEGTVLGGKRSKILFG